MRLQLYNSEDFSLQWNGNTMRPLYSMQALLTTNPEPFAHVGADPPMKERVHFPRRVYIYATVDA